MGHPIHHHCFTVRFGEIRDCQKVYWNVMFVITANSLRATCLPDTDLVLQRLDSSRILLESDTPYFSPGGTVALAILGSCRASLRE